MLGEHLHAEVEYRRPSSDRVRTRPVIEAMSAAPVTVEPDMRVDVAARIADEEGIHHLLVVARERLLGEVCEFDLEAAEPDALVAECMRSPVLTIAFDATLGDAADAMRAHAVGCLPVMWGDQLVGIVTRGDLRRAGMSPETLLPPACMCCKTTTHVRIDPHHSEVTFCVECLDRAAPPDALDEIGGGD